MKKKFLNERFMWYPLINPGKVIYLWRVFSQFCGLRGTPKGLPLALYFFLSINTIKIALITHWIENLPVNNLGTHTASESDISTRNSKINLTLPNFQPFQPENLSGEHYLWFNGWKMTRSRLMDNLLWRNCG